jgi:hypothetical protein
MHHRVIASTLSCWIAPNRLPPPIRRVVLYGSARLFRVLEAQMRGSLHAHILCWFERRKPPPRYTPLGAVPRHTPGTDNRQRPQSQEVGELAEYQEDNLYHVAQVGRIQTEMARPFVGGVVDKRHYGGWDHERLRIAGLARTTAHGTMDAPPERSHYSAASRL